MDQATTSAAPSEEQSEGVGGRVADVEKDEKTTAVEAPLLPPTIDYKNINPDKVLKAFGKYGRYQIFTCAMASSVIMLFASNMMVMPFITKQPTGFYCKLPDGSSWPNDQCQIIDEDNSSLSCLQVAGAKYAYENKHISVASEFDILCDEYESVEHGTSIFMLGGMLATPIISHMSDKFGRRMTFLWPLYLTIGANILCALSPNFVMFLVFRFISGVTTIGFIAVAWVLCTEYVTQDVRSLSTLYSSLIWCLGYMMAGALHLVIPNWRWLYFAMTLPGLLTIPFYWFIPETLHWLTENKKSKGIEKYIKKSSKFNKREIDLARCMGDANKEKEHTVLDIFRSPQLIKNLLVNAFILISMNLTYWALSLFSTDFSENEMVGFFLSGLVELPAGVLGSMMLMMLNRKTVSFLALFIQSMCLFGALFLSGVTGQYSIAFPLLAKVFNSVVWASQPLLYTESAPTSIRTVFTGALSFLGEFGSVFAPYLKRLEAYDSRAPMLLISVLSLIAALLVLLLPETKNKDLSEGINTLKSGPVLSIVKGTTPKLSSATSDETESSV